jgi:membrane-bound metal-dependent hydrolase YbcI (DUF457 family)
MVAVNGSLALGLQRRHGWQIVAWAAVAANLPDVDGLTLMLGPMLYAQGHRCWGHNLLVAGLAAVILSGLAYWTDAPTKVQRRLANRWQVFAIAGKQAERPARSWSKLGLWLLVGVAATYSHLLMDMLFSIGKDLPVWGVPLFWPFSSNEWAYPLATWGDPGPTIIFAVSMFAMLRWKQWTSAIAASSLAAVAFYVWIALGTS